MQLGKPDLAAGIDEGLLIDPADALERPHVKGILRPAVPRTFAPEFAVGFFIGGRFLQRHDLGFRQHQPFLGYRGFQRLQPLPHHLQVMPRATRYTERWPERS